MARPVRPKIGRQPGEIARKFDNQLSALRSSAKGFDGGDRWEAERISAVVQTLCHTGGQTVGLLEQLNLKARLFLDSTDEWRPTNKMAHCTLVSLEMRKGEISWSAELDGRPMRFVPFDVWWNTPVLTDGADSGGTLSRRELTTIMRNQDGGGHVDPLIDSAYRGMLQAIGFKARMGEGQTRDGELFAMRQIGHELLKSLIPTYRKRNNHSDVEAIWRTFVFEEVGLAPERSQQPDYTITPGTDACPCRSGLKFSGCHRKGAQSPDIFEEQSSEGVAPPGAAFAQVGISFSA